MAQAPNRTYRKPGNGEVDGEATLLIANVQVQCPRCSKIIGTEQGCAHWSAALYMRFAGAECGNCRTVLTFPPLPGTAGRIDPRDIAKGLTGEEKELS